MAQSGSLALLAAILLWVLTLSSVGVAFSSELGDRSALLKFKMSVSDTYGVLSGWDSGSSSHCSWTGVLCGPNSRVLALNISGGGTSNAKLGGSISPDVSKLSELRILSLPFNNMRDEIPSEIWEMETLEVLDLEGNSISGSLPSHFGGLRSLRVLNLGFNGITGEIPSSLVSLPALQLLNLAGNKISGTVPSFGGRNCEKLENLDLSGNFLMGRIPGSLGNCRRLRSLLLDSNHLQGIIPMELGRLLKLEVLDLSRNTLSGSIPPSFLNLVSLVAVNLSSNFIDGEIPRNIGRLKGLRILSLSGNNLTGSIPVDLGRLSSLEILDLSSNSLSGNAPEELSNLKNLSALMIDGNGLSGQIHFERFNASFNNVVLSFAVQSADSQGHSPPLISPSSKDGDGNSFNSIEIASICSASAIVSVLIALVVLFIYTRKWNSGSRIVGSSRKEVTIFTDIGVPLTFDDVVRATGSFNTSNCIGSGGFGATYKAEISPGQLVAIKRLSVGRFQGVQQFDAEIQTLGRLRHVNLVTLIGYHASEEEMFLIYNYLPGGNLEKFIQERHTRTVDWRVLHRIALDISRALAYLHDHCVPRVLHRDVKPSNILLDDDYKAYLSDFGLARLLGTSETHATTGVAGTFGYVAPEYALTCRVSDKADVYSYGVVLLELLSDKKALDPSFSSYGNGFNIVTWASMLLRQGRAKEFYTMGLWECGPHDDLVEVLNLAVVCTGELLSNRPTMKQVVRRLRELQPPS